MITIIFGTCGVGKTSFLTHILNTYCFNKERNSLMKSEIKYKNNNGFKLTIPQHCVFANYDITFKKFGYTSRSVNRINPFRLGFVNEFVETHFIPPYSVIGITEGQKYLNSRMSRYFPAWQSRWYEAHRHNNLDIFIDIQRPNLIDINIRELATFIDILKLDFIRDRFGKVKRLVWSINKIENSADLDKYISSGRKECCKFEKIVVNYDVFNLYNSFSCKPLFYAGNLDKDFDLLVSSAPEESLNGYAEYLSKYDDELPSNFYTKDLK